MKKIFKKLNQLKTPVFENAVNHGWHEEELSDAHFFTLVITELCEAVQADRMDTHADVEGFEELIEKGIGNMEAFERRIKDSVEDELADATIRILDYCGLAKVNIKCNSIIMRFAPLLELLSFTEQIYIIIGIASSDYDEVEYKCNLLLYCILKLAAQMNIDLLKFIELKMQYNEYREYRHGGKKY